ncbi:hypothetical protein [Bartonella doshiae]|uniref:hypothetical protein n=1 Tax=Bartonella doshiae TaxID=33044 RepID=UPI001ABA07B2|nr:hypothetical protein [Bartonella doshiae]
MIGQKRYGRGKSFISTSITILKSIHASYKKLHNNQIIHNDPTQHNYHNLPIYAFLSYQWVFEYNAMEEKISEISVLCKKANRERLIKTIFLPHSLSIASKGLQKHRTMIAKIINAYDAPREKTPFYLRTIEVLQNRRRGDIAHKKFNTLMHHPSL